MRRIVSTSFPIEIEMGIAAAILLAWQASRIPLEGTVEHALENARSVLRLEEALALDVERPVIEYVGAHPDLDALLQWAYGEIHTPVLFAFLAAACLLAPHRYPLLRTIFLLSFVPALVVIALYPLAPPHWLVELGLGPAPAQDELAGTTSELFQNSTAAAASQHFGFAVFVAAGSLWLFPRSRIAWAALAYPAIVLVVIVGTGNHYVIDCIIGTLTFACAAAAAAVVHRGSRPTTRVVPPTGVALSLVLGFAMVAGGVESFEAIGLGTRRGLFPDALMLVAGTGLVLGPRLAGRAVSPESGEPHASRPG